MQTRQVVLRERCAPVTFFARRRRFLLGATTIGELGTPPFGPAVRLAAACGLLVALTAPPARAQPVPCPTTSCNSDDIFVGNVGTTIPTLTSSPLVRFSRADICLNRNLATGTIIAYGFGQMEGITYDFDGTIIVATRGTGNVERVCRDGSQRAVIGSSVPTNEGPSFAPNGDLFLNNIAGLPTAPGCITYKASRSLVPFGALTFTQWVIPPTYVPFCEDTRIAPITSPVFPDELYIMWRGFGTESIVAYSRTTQNLSLGTVISDFGAVAGLGSGAFKPLGMAFDSRGDIWVAKSIGPAGMELLEFSASSNFTSTRAVMLFRPGATSPIPNNALVKLCITPPVPNDCLNPGRDTIFVTDTTGPYLHVVDEVSGAQLASLNSNLIAPVGVACCDVHVGVQACCLHGGACVMLDPQSCVYQYSGSSMGSGSQCQGDAACCLPDGTCRMMDVLCCIAGGGNPQSPSSVCLGDGNNNGIDDVCEPPCPLPNPTPSDPCFAHHLDCLGSLPDYCVPHCVEIMQGIPPFPEVNQCTCELLNMSCKQIYFAQIIGTNDYLINCPNPCPLPTENCQVFINSIAQGVSTIVFTGSNIPVGAKVCCDCALPCSPNPCEDGLFCNGVETCDPAGGCIAGDPPCAVEFLCDEEHDTCLEAIPTVSQWGLLVLTLLLLIGAKIYFARRPVATAS